MQYKEIQNKQSSHYEDRINPPFASPYMSSYEPQQPITNPYYNYPPFMYGPTYSNVPSYNYPSGYFPDKNLNPNMQQPSMEQMAQMYYYYQQMLIQQYQMSQMNQMYNPNLKNNIFKK